ncbi:MAG: V-type ATPase subunit [Phycisphaerae bacterium]
MALQTPTDLDYLAAGVHARRSRMAEGDRLRGLVRLRSIPDLSRALYPTMEPAVTAAGLQRRLIRDQARELAGLAAGVGGAGGALLDWLGTRLEVENLKVLARGFVAGLRPEAVRPHLVAVAGPPPEPAPFVAAADVEAFVALLPEGPLRDGAARGTDVYARHPRSFALEAGLDAGYLRELLARAGAAPDREHVRRPVAQEVHLFQMMLAARGRFVFGLDAADLEPFAVRPAALAPLLAAEDLEDLARAAVGHAMDRMPAGEGGVDPADLEALGWDRYARLANTAFRRSHMGLGAVVAYTALRRVELANLIRVSEGIRLGVAPERLRDRLIPRDVA